MFYWNKVSENGTTLESELISGKSIHKVKIASAFLSADAIDVLEKMKSQYGLQKKDVTLYISAEFSSNKPHETLKRLENICTTRIVFDRTFHAKVYLLIGDENKLIFGSSNFTSGGLHSNVEFDSIDTPNETQMISVNKFFAYCENISTEVTSDVIKYYEDNASDIEQLQVSQKKMRRKLSGYVRKNDAFSPEDYEIEDYYFTYEDYEVFFERNRRLSGLDIQAKRKMVQNKMLRIHEKIYSQIKKLGISCHKREDNITSLINPCVYNHHMVGWIGVRYGKTPKEIDALNVYGEKDDIYGFQKHGCLQYCIVDNGFEVNIFLAVKNDAIDRAHMHEKLKILRPNIEKELIKLQGYGMKWVIRDDMLGQGFVFEIDNRNPTEFCDYFKTHDQSGRESYLLMYYQPDDEVLKTLDEICYEVLETIKLLVPLYNAMVYRPQV